MKHYLDVCRKLEKADQVLKNGRIINVFTKEIIEGDLAICNDKIIGIGHYEGKEEIDLEGKYVVPGFIDSHLHIESSMISPSEFAHAVLPFGTTTLIADPHEIANVSGLDGPGFIDSHLHIESSMISPSEFAHAVLPFGTTTLIADPHEIANVSGLDGIDYMLKESEQAPLSIYYMLPSCVPATPMESSGAILDAAKMEKYINHPRILGVGEMMNYPGVLFGDESVLAKIKVAGDKIVDGHAPHVKGDDLVAYAFSGIHTDHECSEIEEVIERLRLGMVVQIRKGTAANNLNDIVSLVAYAFSGIHTDHECSEIEEVIERLRLGMVVQIRKGTAANNLNDIVSKLVKTHLPLTNCVFCTDDKHLEHIFEDGHINSNIRESISLGIDPIEAICMATLYPARVYSLRHKGALAPGYDADLVILDNLETVAVNRVMTKGKWYEQEPSTTAKRYDAYTTVQNTVHCDPISEEDLIIPLSQSKAHVIGLIDGQIITKKLVEEVPVENGYFKANVIKVP